MYGGNYGEHSNNPMSFCWLSIYENPLLHIPPSLIEDIVNNHKKKNNRCVDQDRFGFANIYANMDTLFANTISTNRCFLAFLQKQPLADDALDAGRGRSCIKKAEIKEKTEKKWRTGSKDGRWHHWCLHKRLPIEQNPWRWGAWSEKEGCCYHRLCGPPECW